MGNGRPERGGLRRTRRRHAMIYLFHSWEFLAFYGVILAAHWAFPHRWRTPLLLATSYFFYGSADWRFLALLVFLSLADFALALKIHRAPDERTRRAVFLFALALNLGVFGFFKYFNFFHDSFAEFLRWWGVSFPAAAWRVVLPLGLSFYTFQKLGYVIDVYRRKLTPTDRLMDFLLFGSFFPQLIAGPIERARDLLPQLQAERRWRDVNVRESVAWYVFGFFKKVVIADPLGRLVDAVYTTANPAGGQVLLALYAFSVQLYCDISGYSDMAIGLAGLLGIRLRCNFNLPLFSTDFYDFYRRWHITFSEWIEEYVYTPLFFYIPRKTAAWTSWSSQTRMHIGFLLSLLVTRLAFALWYGAAWNFVLMGVYIFAAQVVMAWVGSFWRRNSGSEKAWARPVSKALSLVVMWHIFSYAMLFFRAKDVAQAGCFTRALFGGIAWKDMVNTEIWYFYGLAAFLFAYETWQYKEGDLVVISRQNFYVQSAFYAFLLFLYIQIGAVADQRFIYFQF